MSRSTISILKVIKLSKPQQFVGVPPKRTLRPFDKANVTVLNKTFAVFSFPKRESIWSVPRAHSHDSF